MHTNAPTIGVVFIAAGVVLAALSNYQLSQLDPWYADEIEYDFFDFMRFFGALLAGIGLGAAVTGILYERKLVRPLLVKCPNCRTENLKTDDFCKECKLSLRCEDSTK
jgi:hypothetical protein